MSCLLAGTIPAANVYALQQQLPGLTRGEGVSSPVRSLRGHGVVVDGLRGGEGSVSERQVQRVERDHEVGIVGLDRLVVLDDLVEL